MDVSLWAKSGRAALQRCAVRDPLEHRQNMPRFEGGVEEKF
jgi:hypothetical protein